MPRVTCLAAAVLATAAQAQFSEFEAAPNKYTLPAGHVATSSRLAAGHFDHDLVLDAFYVSGTSLVIVYGPAVYPYAAKVADGVGDFVVLPPSDGPVPCSDVLVAGGSGVRRVAWNPEPPPVGSPASPPMCRTLAPRH